MPESSKTEQPKPPTTLEMLKKVTPSSQQTDGGSGHFLAEAAKGANPHPSKT